MEEQTGNTGTGVAAYTFLSAVEDAFAEYESSQNWSCSKLIVGVATSLKDDTTVPLNIIDTLGANTRMGKNKKARTLNKYWLPPEFSTNTEQSRRAEVVPYFSKAATSMGFGIRAKGWEGKRNALRLQCERSSFYEARPIKQEEEEDCKMPPLMGRDKPGTTSGTKKVFTTKKAIKGQEDSCPFAFSVFWDPTQDTWYLPITKKGNPNHAGHI